MKILFAFMAVLALIYFSPALMHWQSGSQLRGSTNVQVDKSAMKVRHSMPTQERHAFDVAFGLLKQFKAGEGEDAFAKTVSGLSTDEVVELAKKEVDAKIAAGDPEFKKFTSWEDMLSKEAAEDAPKKMGPAQQAPLRNSERTGRPN